MERSGGYPLGCYAYQSANKRKHFLKQSSGVLNTSVWIARQRPSDGGGKDDRTWGEPEEIE